MELREIQTFLQAAQLKSFSKAAQALGYSQAAVTIQIKNLEQELDTHLFDRIGKQTTLTRQGMIFYEYASSIMKELACAKAAVTESSDLTGTLTIGTIESICASIFPELIRKYHELHPHVKISLILDSPEVLLDRMNKNVIDLVYLLDQRFFDSKWEKVLEEPEDIVFVSSSVYPLAGKESLTLRDLMNEPFLLTEKDASYRLVLDRYLASEELQIHPFLEIGNTEFIINQLNANAGISFLPKFSVQTGVDAGLLSILPVQDFHMRIWRQILYHKDKWITREMNAFIELARQPISHTISDII